MEPLVRTYRYVSAKSLRANKLSKRPSGVPVEAHERDGNRLRCEFKTQAELPMRDDYTNVLSR